MSMSFKSINLKLVVLLVPCILFYAYFCLWNLIVKKINWPNNLIYITTIRLLLDKACMGNLCEILLELFTINQNKAKQVFPEQHTKS